MMSLSFHMSRLNNVTREIKDEEGGGRTEINCAEIRLLGAYILHRKTSQSYCQWFLLGFRSGLGITILS